MTSYLVVLTTFPNIDTAQRIAQEIVQAKLAACVNILPQGQSVYVWEGKNCIENELVALIKTTENNYLELELFLQQLHPYELPEIIATPITNGAKNYLQWITSNTKP